MRKNTISAGIGLVMGVAMLAPAVSVAGDLNFQLYGNVHLSLNFEDGESGTLRSNTSAVGIKGGKELNENGTTVIFKVEFQIDPTERNTDRALVDRDQWVGVKGSFGKFVAGTMSSNYKQMGGKVDTLYRTPVEGRGFLHIQSSRLHGGAGESRGRLTNTLQYTTPKMGNFSVVGNGTFDGNANETFGVGFRYKTKKMAFYGDVFSDGEAGGSRQEAYKIGGYIKGDGFHIGAQIEEASDVTGYDYMFLNGLYAFSKSNMVSVSVGQADGAGSNDDNFSVGAAFIHAFNKATMGYVGYGVRDNDNASDFDAFAIGFRYKF